MADTERVEARLERIAELLDIAKQIVETLECGETAETETDLNHALTEAASLAADLISDAAKPLDA